MCRIDDARKGDWYNRCSAMFVSCHAQRSCHGRTWRVSSPTHDYALGDAGATRDPYRRAIADDLLATDVTRVTVQQRLGHAHVQPMAQYDQ